VSGLGGLDRFNGLPEAEAAEALLAVCRSRRWAGRVAAGRPYADLAALEKAADQAFDALGAEDWREAFAAHPRIGEAGGAAPAWSRQEQAGVGAAGREVQERLARGNAAYEARFGHVFLIAAAGRDAAEILGELERRLDNDPASELEEAAGQQRRIARQRLERLVEG
jgi:OHCU decarboxylase